VTSFINFFVIYIQNDQKNIVIRFL